MSVRRKLLLCPSETAHSGQSYGRPYLCEPVGDSDALPIAIVGCQRRAHGIGVYGKDGSFDIIGETRDDAAGEAYDKIGRILGLPYPGGKKMDEMAHEGKETMHFPRAMIKEDNYDFSFSGLKSSVINTVHNARQKGDDINPCDLAASFPGKCRGGSGA